MPHPRHPPQSAAAVRSPVDRFEVLLRHADPDALLRCLDGPGSSSALDHAAGVTHDLAVVDHHLRALLGEEHQAPAGHAAHEAGEETVADALTRTGNRLARTILGTTDADWQHATIGSHRALDVLTLILHEADRGFHEAERALHATSVAPQPQGAASDRPPSSR